ncbi:MAG: hypothetical protein M3442_11320, partial [Chloroflexota bacterium]|nr:hypothetical protein [Chloroflexota bacterium]
RQGGAGAAPGGRARPHGAPSRQRRDDQADRAQPRVLPRPAARVAWPEDADDGAAFFEGSEALHALRRGRVRLACLVPGHDPAHTTVHERVRAVAQAVTVLGGRLNKAAAPVAALVA